MRFRTKFSLTLLSVVLLLGLFIVFGTSLWMPEAGRMLIHDDEPKPGADAILVLMGSPIDRAPAALALYKAGLAPVIAYARPEDSEINRIGPVPNEADLVDGFFKNNGVPDQARKFYFDSKVSSTWNEAQFLLEKVDTLVPKPRRVVVVTSWYHTSRANWVFQKLKRKDLFVEISPANKQEADDWWHKESSFLAVFNEYLKWIYYVKNY